LTEAIDATEDVPDKKAIRSERSIIRKTKKKCADLRDRELKYTQQLDILGDRNSYSKTDTDATFMRMKEDHMRNGQLKAGYNLQVASSNQFVLGYELYPNPTDTRTLEPVLHTMVEAFQHLPDKIVGDCAYGIESNYDMIMDDYARTALIPYSTYYIEKKNNIKMMKCIQRIGPMIRQPIYISAPMAVRFDLTGTPTGRTNTAIPGHSKCMHPMTVAAARFMI